MSKQFKKKQVDSRMQDNEQLSTLRHSAAHLLAAAVLELYPDTKPAIGPAIEDGFYYDFEFANPISDKDLVSIEQKMRDLVVNWDKFERIEVTSQQAKKQYLNNPYKLELISELDETGEVITFYQSGQFTDLCRGGHLAEPKKQLQHFKLLSIAGAYWRGNEKNIMLTRIYGTAFFNTNDLDKYLFQREEAKNRDHRKIGQEQQLFFIDDLIGKGLIMWLPKGFIIRDIVENLAKSMESDAGYQRVATPHIARKELYETSGHLPYYQDSMYPSMKMDDGVYYLKSMNCPHHHRIYGHQPRSYRDLPLRLAEYGTCYRNELSGTLAGLLRVRALAMNDAHIYCRKDQIKSEFSSVMRLTMKFFEKFELSNYWFRLSKWDPNHTDKYVNQPEDWEYSQQVLREVLNEMGVEYVEADDEAAFYGPKVDVQFKSIVGREETMSTIQLDFVARSRFDLSYVDESGQLNNQVYVIHRAPLSTHERFMAFLIEHYGGKWPFWLSPTQIKILPITDAQVEYAEQIEKQLRETNIRVETDARSERLSAKIRDAQLEKVPYMFIVGGKEVDNQTISVRSRDGGEEQGVQLGEWLTQMVGSANSL